MASEPKKWDGGPDFDPREDPLGYIFSKEEKTFLNSVDAIYAREVLEYINDLFTPNLINSPNYHSYYDSEIESLAKSVSGVVHDDQDVSDVETTSYIEYLLGNAAVVGEMNRAKHGFMNMRFKEISSVAYGAFSDDTRKLLSNYMVNFRDWGVLDERRAMAKVLKHMQCDIYTFREECTKKSHEVRRE